MQRLSIDDREVTVPDGRNVLEAAISLGIVVPHFCYHRALGAVGACRLCAVRFLEGPVKGIKMSCLVEAKDGMVVSTEDPEARQLRKSVAEWLMISHPHDCPVCDEGGECQLQDMTVAAGHSLRRYRGLKRTFQNQHLGPFIEQEMNRCIQCYRCARMYQEYCGGDDFGVLGVNQRVFFGRFQDGRLESPFSGNLADVCPTGALTDKTFRFKARPWDLEEAPSICPNCSLGCATTPGARYRELLRVTARDNLETNGAFICDRGRFGHAYVNHPQRPRTPRVDGRELGWPEASGLVRRRIDEIVSRHGPGSVAILGSPRASLEANALLQGWAKAKGHPIALDVHPQRDRATRAYVALLGDRIPSQEQVRQSDFVLMLMTDLLAEGPMMALAVRQAVRKNALAFVIDPRPMKLPFACSHVALPPWKLGEALEVIRGGPAAGLDAAQQNVLSEIGGALRQAKRPVLIGGVDLLEAPGVEKISIFVEACSLADRPCSASMLLAGPNSFGNALLQEDGNDFEQILAMIEEGSVKALVSLGADPFTEYPLADRTAGALAQLEYLVAMDILPTKTVERSNAFLPICATAESDGSFVNHQGRVQAFEKVFAAGLPIAATGEGAHPPRSFMEVTPGSLPLPDWAAVSILMGQNESLQEVRKRIEAQDHRFLGLSRLDAHGGGLLLRSRRTVQQELVQHNKEEGP